MKAEVGIFVEDDWEGEHVSRFALFVCPHSLAMLLQIALAGSKVLAGRLSICAYCKKIREENDQWTQIEAYLARRLEVSFTGS
jgi:hypothetical protein